MYPQDSNEFSMFDFISSFATVDNICRKLYFS